MKPGSAARATDVIYSAPLTFRSTVVVMISD